MAIQIPAVRVGAVFLAALALGAGGLWAVKRPSGPDAAARRTADETHLGEQTRSAERTAPGKGNPALGKWYIVSGPLSGNMILEEETATIQKSTHPVQYRPEENGRIRLVVTGPLNSLSATINMIDANNAEILTSRGDSYKMFRQR